MADTYIIRHETLDGIAEAIKTKRGRNENIRTEEMAEEILSISTAELPELANPGDAEDLLAGKQMIDETGAVVTGTYSGGTDTSDATATAAEIFAGETAYTALGKVTGTFTIDDEIATQTDLISDIQTTLNGKTAGSGDGLTTCNIALEQTVDNDDGLDIKVSLTIIENGIIKPYYCTVTYANPVIVPNVLCGSSIVAVTGGVFLGSELGYGAEIFVEDDILYEGNFVADILVFQAPSAQGTYQISLEAWF